MQRKVFSAEYKAQVAMEALAGRKTVNEIAGAHEIHPNQVTTWKRDAQEGLKALFERKRGRRSPDEGRDLERLYSPIGRLQVQLEWLKKKSGLNPPE